MSYHIKRLFEGLKGYKVIVYGADVTGLAFLVEAMRAGIDVAYAVDGNKSKWGGVMYGKLIHSPYDLLYEDKDSVKIVVTAPTAKDSIIATLEGMGFERGNQIDVSYIENKDRCSHIDATMGISRGRDTIADMSADVENFLDDGNAARILVLGGSTSDPTYNGIKSWPFYLQKFLNSSGYKARVLVGGVIGYSSSQELLCLLRDGLRLKPDLVISYTGYNDYAPASDINGDKRIPLIGRNLYDLWNRLLTSYKKEKNLPPMYFGEDNTDHFELFLYNARCMNGLCREFGVRYFSLLQPMLKHQKILSGSFEEALLEEEMIKMCIEREKIFYQRFLLIKEQYPWMYDFTSIFSEYYDVFLDACHTNEKGNEIIAQSVLKLLISEGAIEIH